MPLRDSPIMMAGFDFATAGLSLDSSIRTTLPTGSYGMNGHIIIKSPYPNDTIIHTICLTGQLNVSIPFRHAAQIVPVRIPAGKL